MCLSAGARINVVTLPERDSVQLTIYNSVDLTLVKETRHLTFRKGLNRLEFSWANTLEWRINSGFAGDVTVEIRYFTSAISWSAEYLAEANKEEKLMNLSGQVQVTNNSGEDYENAQVRLVVGVIRLVEEIAQLAKVKAGEPHSGVDYFWEKTDSKDRRRAELVLVTNSVITGLQLAGDVKQIIKEGLSEYFLYTVEGRDTIPNSWSKRLPSFKAAEVPITSYYKFEREVSGEEVKRFYRFTNSIPSKLGNEPLPDGSVYAMRLASDDKLYNFVGRTSVKYIPINEAVELELGRDQEVLVKPRLMTWEKSDVQFDNAGNVKGWTIKETWEIELQNSKEIDVTVDLRRNFSGDWTLETTAKYEKVDANKIKFIIPLKANEKQTISYKLTTRFGTNVTK